jgi:NAD(P)-dependent dehydrogenase (short-subunit alcohol dehydrogenase family)
LQSGIGEELTRELNRKGWKVAALDIASQSSLGEKLGQEFGADFIYLPCDVSKYAELADAFSQVFSKWGRIDAFCSNAGIIDRSSIFVFNYRGKTEYVCLKESVLHTFN